MKPKWIEVISIKYKGKRFADHSIDVGSLAGLSKFEDVILQIAKAAWRTAHPDRDRVPRNFEKRLRLCVQRIDPGSVSIPLMLRLTPSDTEELFDDIDTVVHRSARVVADTIAAAVDSTAPPEEFPRSLLPTLHGFFDFQEEDEAVEIKMPKRRAVRITPEVRNRIEGWLSQPHQERIELIGEVYEADVKSNRFHVLTEDHRRIQVEFQAIHETSITTALRDHASVRLQLSGRATYNADGSLCKVDDILEMQILAASEERPTGTLESLWTSLDELSKEVPESEWEKLPSDLSENLDEYLYNRKKR